MNGLDVISTVLALNQLRLDRDLTYRKLSVETGIPYRTLFGLLNNANPRMRDRTLHKIRRYLDAQNEQATVS